MKPNTLVVVALAALFSLGGACGSDPKPTEPCASGAPDFEVLVTAAEGPLPEDLVLHVEYGGGEEDYVLAHPGTPAVVFCHPADREGNVLDGGALPSPGAGGEGGGAPVAGVEALFCQLWSFGSARIIVETEAYPMVEPLELTRRRGVCTGEAELELSQPDGGT